MCCTTWKYDNRNICIISFWVFFMTEWSFSQNIFLITKHLDLIFYRLLTWFHLRGKNRNNGQIPHKWKVGLFCQHTKQGQLDRTLAKGFQRFKNALLSFGKKDQGTTTSCIWTRTWGKWGGELDSTCELACSNAHNTHWRGPSALQTERKTPLATGG